MAVAERGSDRLGNSGLGILVFVGQAFWSAFGLKEQPPGKNYFLGNFLFELDGSGDDTSWHLFVIDGQQRLTTVIIFFSCLVRELDRRGEPLLDTAGPPLASEVCAAVISGGPRETA